MVLHFRRDGGYHVRIVRGFVALPLADPCLSRIQPPNTWHEVYTPQTSVTIGGHFYTYDTLHLTDAARCYDIKVPGTTNQHHSSSQLILCAMMVDITRRGPRGNYRRVLCSGSSLTTPS